MKPKPAPTPREGMKLDEGKTRYELIDAEGLELLAQVYTFGTKKYAPENWRIGFKWQRCIGSLLRHVFAFLRGEEVNAESGLPHLMHAAWWCFTLVWFSKYRRELDDRPLFTSTVTVRSDGYVHRITTEQQKRRTP